MAQCTRERAWLGWLVFVWYAANLGFNMGMKRSHALVPDVFVLTTFQFAAGALTYGAALLFSAAVLPRGLWAALGGSATLLLGGTLFTNVSLTLLSVSFTHVIKTCEPFFTVVIVYLWDRKMPEPTACLALGVTVLGVLVASTDQRARSGKSSSFSVGVGVAMLANLCLQLRNVLNKKLMAKPAAAPEAEYLRPLNLLLATLTAGLPMNLVLQATVDTYAALQPTPPTASRYAHYGDANLLWLLVTPTCFVVYQVRPLLGMWRP